MHLIFFFLWKNLKFWFYKSQKIKTFLNDYELINFLTIYRLLSHPAKDNKCNSWLANSPRGQIKLGVGGFDRRKGQPGFLSSKQRLVVGS